MSRWAGALNRTRGGLSGGLRRLFSGRQSVSDAVLDEIEESLILADIPPRLAAEWVDEVRMEGVTDDVWTHIAGSIKAALDHDTEVNWQVAEPPHVILLVGVNGAGKTTTAAKLAHHLMNAGKRPLLAATDTFRAAGTDQLRMWAERVGCEIVAGNQGSDAAPMPSWRSMRSKPPKPDTMTLS